jgi:hypothetical protein
MVKCCELCGTYSVTDMRYSKRTACFKCIDKILEFAITSGMVFEDEQQ